MSMGGNGSGQRFDLNGSDQDARPNWLPLKRRLEVFGHGEAESLCASFMWVRRGHGIEFYKHVDTGRYLLLDLDQNCWRYAGQRLELASFERQLAEVSAN